MNSLFVMKWVCHIKARNSNYLALFDELRYYAFSVFYKVSLITKKMIKYLRCNCCYASDITRYLSLSIQTI